MKKHLILLLIVAAAILIGIAYFEQLGRKNSSIHESTASGINIIKTKHPVRHDFYVRLRWFGTVESKKTVKITPLTDGRVMKIKVADGAYVKTNDLLFTLGGKNVIHEQKILGQRISYLENQVSLVGDVVKSRNYSVSKKLITREGLLAAKVRLAGLIGELSVVRQKLASLNDSLLIYSPLDGTFTNRRISPGQEIDRGTHLADVISGDLRIVARVFPPEGVLLNGKKVVAQTASGMETAGLVSRVLPQLTVEGATKVWIESREINDAMKPGESVSGWIVLEIHKNALAVPKNAVVRDREGHTLVFVKTPRGYTQHAVKTGIAHGGLREIISGISLNNEVVVNGAYELFHKDFSQKYKLLD